MMRELRLYVTGMFAYAGDRGEQKRTAHARTTHASVSADPAQESAGYHLPAFERILREGGYAFEDGHAVLTGKVFACGARWVKSGTRSTASQQQGGERKQGPAKQVTVILSRTRED